VDNEIDQLLSLSQEIHSQALQGKWEEVETLQAQRAKLIQSLESLDQSQLDLQADQMRDAIQEVKRLDAESLMLAGKEKQQLTCDHSQHMKGKKMQQAYGALK